MSVRVGSEWSERLPVYGGVPQGSILGVLLFNVTTDDLEDDAEEEDPTPVDDGHDHLTGPPDHTASTPVDDRRPLPPELSPVYVLPGDDGDPDPQRFVFLPTARNVRRGMRRPSDELEVPPEPAPRTSAKWVQPPEKLFKYVDDHVQVLKLNTETCLLYTSPSPRD